LIHGNAKGYVKMIMDRFKKIGYRCQLFLVNAADCGVPQKRERVFFCALRNDIDKPKLILNPTHRWISAGEALIDLQTLTDDEIRDNILTEKQSKFWNNAIPGDIVNSKTDDGKWGVYYGVRLSDKKPSNTVLAGVVLTHWNKCRSLTYREWKRLGSFPDDYIAKTDKIGKYMIGMSVPPKMTEQVAKAVIEQWLS
jgi:DNA (cytosine-5)-methyltransferase 1